MDGFNLFLSSLAKILSYSRYGIRFRPSSQKKTPISHWQDCFLHGLQKFVIKTRKYFHDIFEIISLLPMTVICQLVNDVPSFRSWFSLCRGPHTQPGHEEFVLCLSVPRLWKSELCGTPSSLSMGQKHVTTQRFHFRGDRNKASAAWSLQAHPPVLHSSMSPSGLCSFVILLGCG